MMQPPYPPKKLETAGAPAGLRLEPPPVSDAIRTIVERLPSARRSFVAWDELPPRHQSQTDDSWTSLPTPLASRTITAPWPDATGRYDAVVLTLHPSREQAVAVAAKRVVSEGQLVHRSLVEMEASSLEVVDARKLKKLTKSALLAKDVEAWQLLKAVRDQRGAEAVWINSPGREDVIVMFIDSLDATMHVRDEAVHEIDKAGNALRVRAIDSLEPRSEPFAMRSSSRLRAGIIHIAIAVLAGLLIQPVIALVGLAVGVDVKLPVIVPVLLGSAPASRSRARRRGSCVPIGGSLRTCSSSPTAWP